MLVTGIEITHYRYCPISARHLASVCLTLKDRIVTLFCQLDLPENESPRLRARAFVGEATRQLCRMPEIRSGRDRLEFSPDLVGCPPPEMA
ncbi:MAG: hypothetical protein ACK5MY_07975 [Jhaorihella sp.]